MVLDDLSSFLENRAFVGFENDKYPFTAVFGAESGHPLLRDMLDMFEGKDFIYNHNDPLNQTNTGTVSAIRHLKERVATKKRAALYEKWIQKRHNQHE